MALTWIAPLGPLHEKVLQARSDTSRQCRREECGLRHNLGPGYDVGLQTAEFQVGCERLPVDEKCFLMPIRIDSQGSPIREKIINVWPLSV